MALYSKKNILEVLFYSFNKQEEARKINNNPAGYAESLHSNRFYFNKSSGELRFMGIISMFQISFSSRVHE